MTALVYDKVEQLPENFIQSLKKLKLPQTVLMCPPDNFAVIDVKNPHMEANVGKVNKDAALKQWQELRKTFEASGAAVELIEASPDCEDMVFCANQTFVGPDQNGKKVCVLSQMKHESRQREVPAFASWFKSRSYEILELPAQTGFEGSGDAIWHPGLGLIWGGSGFRSSPEAYPHLSRIFGFPVIRLPLRSERFYHLDTCFCAVDERTVLVHPASLTEDGMELVKAVFENVIECDDYEANEGMACNATAIGGRHVIIQKGNPTTVGRLRESAYTVHEVETSEYLKSGGSVFCMKMYVF